MEAGYQFEYIRDPLSYRPTGTTAPGRNSDEGDADVIVYETVAGDDEINHYVNLQVTLRY